MERGKTGKKVNPGRMKIWLVVIVSALLSVGSVRIAAAVVIPNEVGNTAESATAALIADMLVVAQVQDYSTDGTYASGVVMAQSPAPGSDVPVGSTVTLTVSRGTLTPDGHNMQGLVYSLCGMLSAWAFCAGIILGRGTL